MVMWSHEMMMKHSRLDNETKEILDRLVEKFGECKHGQRVEALSYLGFNLPALSDDSPWPLQDNMVDRLLLGQIRSELPTLHGWVMDLCSIGSGQHLDDAIIDSIEVKHLGDVTYIRINDNRSDTRDFTIKVKAAYTSVEVQVYVTGQEGRYGDLRDEGHVIAWKAGINHDAMGDEEGKRLYLLGSKEGWLAAMRTVPIDKCDVGVEDRNTYFLSRQKLFGMVLHDCWHSFKDKFGEIDIQPELDLFGEIV